MKRKPPALHNIGIDLNRGVTGQDDIAGQSLEQFQQLYVVLFRIVETVSAPRCTGVMEIGRIAVSKAASARGLRSMPILCSAGGLRFMIAPPPRWVSI